MPGRWPLANVFDEAIEVQPAVANPHAKGTIQPVFMEIGIGAAPDDSPP